MLTYANIYYIIPDYLFHGSGEILKNTAEIDLNTPSAKELIELGVLATMDEFKTLAENSNAFRFHIFGYAAEYIFKNKAMLLTELENSQKKNSDETPYIYVYQI